MTSVSVPGSKTCQAAVRLRRPLVNQGRKSDGAQSTRLTPNLQLLGQLDVAPRLGSHKTTVPFVTWCCVQAPDSHVRPLGCYGLYCVFQRRNDRMYSPRRYHMPDRPLRALRRECDDFGYRGRRHEIFAILGITRYGSALQPQMKKTGANLRQVLRLHRIKHGDRSAAAYICSKIVYFYDQPIHQMIARTHVCKQNEYSQGQTCTGDTHG